MIGCLLVKDGVKFTRIAPGGFRILTALNQVALTMSRDLTITSACDGRHSGLSDPHPCGKAYDVRSHDLSANTKQQVLELVMAYLSNGLHDEPKRTSGGLATIYFFGFLEAPNNSPGDEHFHFQVRHGVEFP